MPTRSPLAVLRTHVFMSEDLRPSVPSRYWLTVSKPLVRSASTSSPTVPGMYWSGRVRNG
jgi:hypothetical protein